jgi:DNA-directed RNA polymerase subunit RPC12/RpoP
MATRSCTRCRSQTEPARLDTAAGESEPVGIRLRDMPVLACPNGHRQFIEPAFALKLVEHLVKEDEAGLPAGKEKGLVFTHYHCGACGTELGKDAERRETFPLEVSLPEYGRFRVELTAPVYRCPKCSREQLHSLEEVRKHTPPALAEAFRAAEIPPA